MHVVLRDIHALEWLEKNFKNKRGHFPGFSGVNVSKKDALPS